LHELKRLQMKKNQSIHNSVSDITMDGIGLLLIGKKCKINYYNEKFNGVISNETKNTISLQTENGTKTLQKSLCLIKIKDNNINYQYDGKKLIGRQEDRIKRKIKRKW